MLRYQQTYRQAALISENLSGNGHKFYKIQLLKDTRMQLVKMHSSGSMHWLERSHRVCPFITVVLGKKVVNVVAVNNPPPTGSPARVGLTRTIRVQAAMAIHVVRGTTTAQRLRIAPFSRRYSSTTFLSSERTIFSLQVRVTRGYM